MEAHDALKYSLFDIQFTKEKLDTTSPHTELGVWSVYLVQQQTNQIYTPSEHRMIQSTKNSKRKIQDCTQPSDRI